MDNMSSHTLLDLPREILELIFSHLCPHCLGNTDPIWPDELVDLRQTLLALCLVCEQLRSSAQSILFHEYHLAFTFEGELDNAESDGPLLPFLKAIIQRPYLASQVKRFSLSSSQLIWVNRSDAQSVLEEAALAMGTTLPKAWASRVLDTPGESASLQRLLGFFVHKRDICIEEQRLSDQEQQCVDTKLICMALALLPRLEHISLDIGYFPQETNLVPSVQALGITTLPLQSVSLYNGHDSLALKFLQLTNCLETLHIHKFNIVLPEEFVLLNLTTLRLTRCQFHMQDLRNILVQCVNLEVFFYELCWPGEVGYGFDMFDDDHIPLTDPAVNLHHCRRTLRNLHLDLRKWANGHNPGRNIQPIASLEDFGALQHLFLHSALLPVCQTLPLQHSDSTAVSIMASERWARFLPRTIVSLHLARDINEIRSFSQAVELAGLADAVVDGRFPFLKEVRCDANPRSSGFLEEKYTAAGVDFKSD